MDYANRKYSARAVGWVVQLCRSWLSLGKAPQISHGRKFQWDNTVVKTTTTTKKVQKYSFAKKAPETQKALDLTEQTGDECPSVSSLAEGATHFAGLQHGTALLFHQSLLLLSLLRVAR